jgi:hypothetical protein
MGRERVEFNANWVFAPQTILTLASSCGLRLQKFLLFNPKLGVQDLSGETVERISTSIAQENYHLAIMQFARTHASLPESASLGPQHRAE